MDKKSLVVGVIAAATLMAIPEAASAYPVSASHPGVELTVDKFGRTSLGGKSISEVITSVANMQQVPQNSGCTQNGNCSCVNVGCF